MGNPGAPWSSAWTWWQAEQESLPSCLHPIRWRSVCLCIAEDTMWKRLNRGSWDGGTIVDYLGGFRVITSVFIKGSQEGQGERSMWGWKQQSEGREDARLLPVKMESGGRQQALQAGQANKTGPSLEPAEGTQAFWHPDFSTVKMTLDFSRAVRSTHIILNH